MARLAGQLSGDEGYAQIAEFDGTFRMTAPAKCVSAGESLTPARNPWRQAGDHVVYVPFDRIELITRPSTSPFRPRNPPPEFRQRSYLHRYLAEIVDKERVKIEKHRQ